MIPVPPSDPGARRRTGESQAGRHRATGYWPVPARGSSRRASDHTPAGRGEVVIAEHRQADQLVAGAMSGIALEEKANMRILLLPLWNSCQVSAQALGARESHDPCPLVVAAVETFSRQRRHHLLHTLVRRGIMAWPELAPE